MLVRAYRLTDRAGVVILKSSVAFCDWTLLGLSVVRRGGTRAFGGMVGAATAVSKPVSGAAGVVRTRAKRSTSAAATGAMARRAARAEIKAGVAEDPLRVQNRVLSFLVILLGVIVLGVVLWATDPSRAVQSPLTAEISGANVVSAAQPNINPAPLTPQQNAPLVPPTNAPLPSPVPTATALPPLLEVRGSIAFVSREKGQSDIWVIPVGSRTPLRLTNSPDDDRDPAWSPDGKKLAYASRQDGNWELYVYDLTSGDTTRMTYDLSFQGGPQWSPDGEWLVYESYQGNNLDVYVMRLDGSQTLRLTDDPAPDFSPTWSPDGRTVAFVSWRDGNEDIYTFSLDDQSVANVTNTPTRFEECPSWSPDGKLLAFSALDEGLEKVFVQQVGDPNATAQVLDRGRAPTWSPDGSSIVFAVDSLASTHLVAGPFAGVGVATEIIPVSEGATDPVWTSAPLPAALINSGGLSPAITQALYVEQESDPSADPPYRLHALNDVSAPNAVLSERVDDSFMALREHVLNVAGWDFLGQLEDAFWQMNRPPQPGEERRNWLMTGRSFAINRNAIVGFPAPVEVVREDISVGVYWRVYVRVSDEAQSGELGEPLRHLPWDFASRNEGDVEAYDQGGRLRSDMPSGYYVDLTQIAADYGWERVPAGNDWRANFNSTNYWLFQKRENLDWYSAMRELYTEGQLGGFAPRGATPATNPPQLPTLPPEQSAPPTSQPAPETAASTEEAGA
jgi:TolB protein